MMSLTIHSFWIEGPLRPLNLLTIRSFKKHGHRFVLYAYDTKVTDECEVRDAREILPERELFFYKRMQGGNPHFKYGGIAERLKAEMLYKLGGWHVDLDVTCLKPFDCFTEEYVLRPHPTGIVANMIKAPAGCELARRYVEHTKTIDENNVIWEKSFLGLNKIVAELKLGDKVVKAELLGMDEDKYWRALLMPGNEPHKDARAIHWCAAMNMQPHPDSFLSRLYDSYGFHK